MPREERKYIEWIISKLLFKTKEGRKGVEEKKERIRQINRIHRNDKKQHKQKNSGMNNQ